MTSLRRTRILPLAAAVLVVAGSTAAVRMLLSPAARYLSGTVRVGVNGSLPAPTVGSGLSTSTWPTARTRPGTSPTASTGASAADRCRLGHTDGRRFSPPRR
ncbi:hypothetical protein Acsp05_50550 [Actinokineospora sp. NBRC 105648]|nr:hypothetical protein Acsp05_50550 [Actinokineospora sp. NBRC 105648]